MIVTARLMLRAWREADKPRFHDIVNTPAMMEHFGGLTTRAALDALLDTQIAGEARDGFSMWAVDWRATGELIGVCGLRRSPILDTPVTGELEIGWRVAEPFWGTGVAREAATASLAWGWANTAHPRVVAFTTAGNERSLGLMRRLGMHRRDELAFRHPRYAADDPLGAMIVHAIDRPAA